MTPEDAFRDKPTLKGPGVVLRPLTAAHAEDFWLSGRDPEIRRLTGTHRDFTREEIKAWVSSRAQQTDRLDLAIHRRSDDAFFGELALLDLDPVNESVALRISLAGPAMTGQGFGTEAMRLTLNHAFATVGIHRVHLDVYAFNTAAIKTYERLGFIHEGRLREALLWDGKRHDALLMSMLRHEWDAAG
jgi:RimJ/RimL family protein N-acetyltransferase